MHPSDVAQGSRPDLRSGSRSIPGSGRVTGPRDRSGKYLVFRLGDEEFGIEVLKVREITGLQEITSVPHTPAFVKGVLNLRGRVIPVVDLRLKFGLDPRSYSERTCVIVVMTHQHDDEVTIAIIVDEMAEVLTLHEADIEDPPDFGVGVATSYLRGMAKIKGKVKILLDVDEVLSIAEMTGQIRPPQPENQRALAAADTSLRPIA